MARRLSVLAGSGALVSHVVDAALAAGDEVQVVALRPQPARQLVTEVSGTLDAPNAIFAAVMAFRSTHVVMAGAIEISDRQRERFLPEGRFAMSRGDAAMSRIDAAIRSATGAEVIGAHEVAVDLLAEVGSIAGPQPSDALLATGRLAIGAARDIGRLDLGQAVVMVGARLVAAEDVAGTDDLIRRVGRYHAEGLVGNGAGVMVLAKASKPNQPSFVDLPAIGPNTVVNAAATGIRMIAVEAGRTLVLDRAVLVTVAAEHGIAVYGLVVDG